MAATTNISWTNATANFWTGCTPVGPGCDHCYAAALAKRRWNITFESGGERKQFKAGYGNPLRWQAMRERGQTHMRVGGEDVPVPLWVFAMSLGDFLDNEVPDLWRNMAWDVIRRTPLLRWQIVTKRVGNFLRMSAPDWSYAEHYQHVGIVATVCNQAEFNRDMPRLAALKKDLGVKWVGLSIEPQIGHVDCSGYEGVLDWIITGGESRQPSAVGGAYAAARPYHLDWALDLIAFGARHGIPVFTKQLGALPMQRTEPGSSSYWRLDLPDRQAGADPSDWPDPLRVQQMPRVYDDPDTSDIPECDEDWFKRARLQRPRSGTF